MRTTSSVDKKRHSFFYCKSSFSLVDGHSCVSCCYYWNEDRLDFYTSLPKANEVSVFFMLSSLLQCAKTSSLQYIYNTRCHSPCCHLTPRSLYRLPIRIRPRRHPRTVHLPFCHIPSVHCPFRLVANIPSLDRRDVGKCRVR